MSSQWTIQSLLSWSQDYLENKDIDSPRATAEFLLADALRLKRMELYLEFDKPLEKSELSAFKDRLRRRVQGEPTQYILGMWEFWSMPLFVNSKVLIPRPETECLVEMAIHYAKERGLSERGPFLDLCTGSGAIACALAKEFPHAKIHAADLSKEALDVARKNIAYHHLTDRIELHHGDLFDPLEKFSFSMILTNPPYIKSDTIPTLQGEVRLFEPTIALDGGRDGLSFVRKILYDSPRYLSNQGVLLCEIGSDQGVCALAEAKRVSAFQTSSLLQDYTKKDRILVCFRGID